MKRFITVVIPAYNESDRLNLKAFHDFLADNAHITLLFVNDGSSDRTGEILDSIQCRGIEVLRLPTNTGKAEAVRQGILKALEKNPNYVGYWDADLATPLEDILSFSKVLNDNEDICLVMGARVKLLGRHIKRNELRHYAGRVFATFASMVLGIPVYDTQCGAKLFRVNDQTSLLFSKPFISRWVFNVEIIARLCTVSGKEVVLSIIEYPLKKWTDVPGSKAKPLDFFKALIELIKIRRRYYCE